MKTIKMQLKTISKSLTSLSKQVDRISKQVEKLQATKKAAPARRKKTAHKAAARKKTSPARGKTVLDTVYGVIRRSPNGASIATLKKRTGLDSRQLSNALYKLTKKRMVRAKSRGHYVKK
jgi:hypothetical protein